MGRYLGQPSPLFHLCSVRPRANAVFGASPNLGLHYGRPVASSPGLDDWPIWAAEHMPAMDFLQSLSPTGEKSRLVSCQVAKIMPEFLEDSLVESHRPFPRGRRAVVQAERGWDGCISPTCTMLFLQELVGGQLDRRPDPPATQVCGHMNV